MTRYDIHRTVGGQPRRWFEMTCQAPKGLGPWDVRRWPQSWYLSAGVWHRLEGVIPSCEGFIIFLRGRDAFYEIKVVTASKLCIEGPFDPEAWMFDPVEAPQPDLDMHPAYMSLKGNLPCK
jgi:hypothetical protein